MIGLSLNIQNSYLSNNGLSALTNRYVKRVEAAGGIVESRGCLETDFSTYNWKYYFRVIDNGGVVESLECLIF